ncbi:lon protease homolog 2, peroxisomal-like [Oratosquilla oratoria]|uniref:lon protease homolog 2, peroxisomal-like n=1 Tax=Oratosquilla oratoria TaxID=337810 RepID=UPI003F75DC4D
MAPSAITIPRKLPLLIVSDGVLLPGSSIRIPVSTSKNINLVRSRIATGNQLSNTVIGVVTKEEREGNVYGLHPIGTAGMVVQVTVTNWPRPVYTLLVTGICRFRMTSIVQEYPYPVAMVTQLDNHKGEMEDDTHIDKDLEDLVIKFKEGARRLINLLDVSLPIVSKLKVLVDKVPNKQLADVVVGLVKASLAERLQVLDAVDLASRLRVILPLLLRHIQRLEVLKEDGSKENEKNNLKMHICGNGHGVGMSAEDEETDDIQELENQLKDAGMPQEAYRVAMKELSRLKRMAAHMPEYSMTRNYLELLADLPWSYSVKETCSISKARADLDTDHYGLEKVKRRILEYLAVRQLRGDLRGPILCFVGPPGVGKTSVARSIANTLGRPFHRISLGGVSDQHDIRGHRRTYIGAMPGRVIQGLREVQAKNPVFLLDEIDKLGSGIQGDPGAALLEVLDPAQNFSFIDTYVNLPFDLSQVLFVATANSLRSIPPPLLDRMEIIHVPGYTQEEKVMIGQLHLIPKQVKDHGLTSDTFTICKESLVCIISEYTREAGVRTLERKIGAVCRAVAVQIAENMVEDDVKPQEMDIENNNAEVEGEEKEELPEISLGQLQDHQEFPIVVDEKMVHDILGPPIFQSGLAGRVSVPGVAVGLAWTPVGGEVLVVEASRSDGDPGLILTGQLGSVMQESAKIALSWVRQNVKQFGIDADLSKAGEIHMHFPVGAISKDGPSAGVTIITVLVSLLSGRCVRPDVAMTGEITLNGIVLPVGGIKEKILAAHRAGLTIVIIPVGNKKDISELPKSVLDEVEVVLVNTVDEVLQAAFQDGFPHVYDLGDDTPTVTSKL